MTEGIDQLLEKLVINEADKEIVIASELVDEAISEQVPSLLARLYSRRMVKVEILKSALMNFWQLKGDFRVSEVGENFFLFQFERQMDKKKILQQQPWNHNKSLLVFRDYDGVGDPLNFSFDWCPFWTQLHGIPVVCMVDKIVRAIGGKIGQVEEVDLGKDGLKKGRYAKLKIRIDIHCPLVRSISVTLPSIGSVQVSVCYEHLGDFCFVCGCLDYVESDCGVAIQMKD